MGRAIERLTVDALPALPGGCGSCLFWESPSSVSARTRVAGEAGEEKAAWVSGVLREWGSCGRVVRVDGEVAAHIGYAPPAYLDGAATMPTGPVSSDAVLVTGLYVDPRFRRQGLGRLLVQQTARDLHERRGHRAIEAFGDSHGNRPCLAPTDFWLAVGFRTHRSHRSTPRLRMDLRTTVTWRQELETALERLLVGIRVPLPEGARRGE